MNQYQIKWYRHPRIASNPVLMFHDSYEALISNGCKIKRFLDLRLRNCEYIVDASMDKSRKLECIITFEILRMSMVRYAMVSFVLKIVSKGTNFRVCLWTDGKLPQIGAAVASHRRNC